MIAPYIEQDCTIHHDGRPFTSGGAIVTEQRIVAYLGKATWCGSRDGVLTDWHGHEIGTYHVTATWKTPRSYVSSEMYQVLATLKDGARYTGRSAGVGMIFRGKRTH